MPLITRAAALSGIAEPSQVSCLATGRIFLRCGLHVNCDGSFFFWHFQSLSGIFAVSTSSTTSNKMIKKEMRAALLSTLLLATILILCAAADPGGLFAIVSWSGSHPVAAWWWWAPYVVFLPALLILHYAAVLSLTGSVCAGTARSWLFFRIWLLQIPVMACAWLINALVVLYGSMAGKTYLLSFSATFAFLFWSGGYATLKMACLGWLPALGGLFGIRNSNQTRLAVADSERLATLTAGLVMLMLALCSPWLASHWWQGSPLGYIYREFPGMPVPLPAAGPFIAALTLLLCGVVVRFHARSSFARQNGVPSALFAAGMLAGVMAAAVLFVVQTIALLLHGIASPASADAWFIPALILLATETASFALFMAGCAGVAVLLGLAVQRLQNHGLSIGAAGLTVAVAVALFTPGLAHHSVTGPVANGMAVTVRHDRDHAILANQRGSQVLLRGVNVNQLGQYWQADTSLAAAQPLTSQDFVDMAALGINSVRLTLSWSRLEPQRGVISEQYLEQISQAAGWAADNHIYVVLDMHQDAWSATVAAPKGIVCRDGTEPMKGWDGAPAWATLTDAAPPCQFTGRDLAPNVSRAFQSFYFDRDGIQTELVHAWAILAGRFADNSTVLGYDLLNEPNFAETPTVTSTLLLANYYARAIAAIRRAETAVDHGYAHPVVIEPSIFWSGFGVDNLPPAGFTNDQQLVYSPHLYNESITSDQDLGVNLISIERGFRLAQHAATQLNAALWIGEWGFFGDSQQQASLWERQARTEDLMQTGSAIWVWKQGCGDPHVYPGKSAGNIVRADCPANQPVATDAVARRILQRPYVQSAPGRIIKLERSEQSFAFSGSADNLITPVCDLQVWIPGTDRPTLNVSAGISNPQWQRIEPGSALLGASGGWILHACVSEKRYHLEIG